MKRAIITINIGERHQKFWDKICKPNWEMYAQKFGLDIINFKEPLDQSERASKRSPSWQKCLILSQAQVQEYDQVLWLDSDILINNAGAPNVFDLVPVQNIAGVEDWVQPTPALYNKFIELQKGPLNEKTTKEYYTNFGLPDTFSKVMQGGVFVASPKRHREILEGVYYNYEDKGPSYWHYEMRPLSYEIQKSGLIEWLPGKFNYVWSIDKFLENLDPLNKAGKIEAVLFKAARRLAFETGINLCPSYTKKMTQYFHQSYFLHFAGNYADMLFMKGIK